MDRIHVQSPIRNYRLKQPVVFTFNVLLNHYLAFKTSHYHTVQRLIQKENHADKFHLSPNITSVSMNIEQRADILAKNLRDLSKRH